MSEHHHTSAATEQPRGMEPILNSLMQATLDVTTTSRPALRKRFEEILRGQVRDAAQQPRGYLYTLRGTESYCPTRLPQCIALGWHEIPLYEGARCSGSTSVSKTEGDGSIPSASATAQCSAGTEHADLERVVKYLIRNHSSPTVGQGDIHGGQTGYILYEPGLSFVVAGIRRHLSRMLAQPQEVVKP
jgi:hypothetical protein